MVNDYQIPKLHIRFMAYGTFSMSDRLTIRKGPPLIIFMPRLHALLFIDPQLSLDELIIDFSLAQNSRIPLFYVLIFTVEQSIIG